MKSGKKVLFLLFCGIFILLICIVLPDALTEKLEYLSGHIGMNKAVITVKLSFKDNQELTPGNIRKLAKEFKTDKFNYAVYSDAMEVPVKAGGKIITADLTGTNYMLPDFYRCYMLHGSFFTHDSETEGGPVAVVDERFAWNAYMTDDVVGKTLELYGNSFKIIGVIKTDDSILSRIAGDQSAKVYILGEKMLELDKAASLKTFQLGTQDTSTMNKNKELIAESLRSAGYNPKNFVIADLNITKALLKQKSEIIIFVLGFISVIYLFRWIWNLVRALITEIGTQCKTDYFATVIKANITYVCIMFIKLSTAVIAIYFLITHMVFKLYIPPEYLPEELIDINFYLELLFSKLTEAAGNPDHLTDVIGTMVNGIGLITGVVMLLFFLAGIFMFYAGLTVLNPDKVNLQGLVLGCGLFTLFSLALLAITAGSLGLPFYLRYGKILVIWAFIYISIWFKYDKHERKDWVKQ